MKNYCLVAFVGTVMVASIAANAQSTPPNVVGKYSATAIVNRLPQPLFIEIKNLKPGDREAARITYALPRDCGILAAYGGYVESTHVFYGHYYSGSSSTFCGRNTEVVLKLKLNEDRQLMYELAKGSDVIEAGLLSEN